jgi:Fe-coproporphyrin III synthase
MLISIHTHNIIEHIMVDLIYGRGISDILLEMPFYINLIKKYIGIKFFNSKSFIYGSVDINNTCNLHCSHCYWWLNRKNENEDLTASDWKKIIRERERERDRFKKEKIFVTTLIGGEPLLRPDIIKTFCDEMPRRVCVVTNGTLPIPRFDNLYFYWISLDGTEKIHDSIRGKGSYKKTKDNILKYITGPKRNGKPVWKDF